MNVGEVFVRMALDDRDYKKGLARMEGFTQQKALTLGSIFKGAFSFAIGIGVIQGFRSLGGAITDFVNTAARTEVLDVAMLAVARSTRHTTAEIREQEEALRDLGIAKQEAKQMLTRFMQAQIDVADVTKLARVAQDAAVIAGYNSSEAAQQMTDAIAKQRPELLTAFGFTRNLNDIYNDYAKTVGKTVKQLSEIEKKQAMVNYILKEGEKIAGTYEASMGAVGKIIGSLKRYWDDLKDAIAMPLALPAVSVIVDGITNSLKSAIIWAEANKVTLQMWGQTAADVAGAIVRAFKYVAKIFMGNWTIIKYVGIALLTLTTLTTLATAKTALFSITTRILNSQLIKTSPLLGAVSAALVAFQVQMAAASATGGVFIGVLHGLRAAVQAFWASLGPIGWAIIAISLAVTGGMALWNKYTQSLQKAAQTASPANLVKGFRDLEKSTEKSADATEDQADALDKAGKAASKNLQSFDEIHQLQGDMAGSGEDMLDALDLDLDTDIPALDFESMMAGLGGGLEGIKPTLKGFWEWIKEQAGNLWDGVKGKWNSFANWVKGWAIWDWLGQKWSGLKDLAVAYFGGIWDVVSTAWSGIGTLTGTVWGETWNLLKTYWDNLGTLANTVFGGIWDFIVGTWENIKNATSAIWGAIWNFLKNQWETIKAFGGNIFGILGDLITRKIDLRTAIKLIWEEIKKFLSDTWKSIKTLGEGIWNALGEFLKTQWELIKNLASTTWTAILNFLKNNWDATKAAASTIWEAIKKFFGDTWESIKTNAKNVWGAILKFLGINWEELKKTASEKWADIRATISNKWEEIKTDAFNWGRKIITAFTDGIKDRISKVRTTFSNVAGTIKDYLGFSSPTKLGPGRFADEWAPNLISMYSKGLTDSISMIQDAASTTISGLTDLDIGDATIAGKQAGISPPAFAPTPTASGDMTVIVKIGEDTIMERVISNINRRSRISGETVIIT